MAAMPATMARPSQLVASQVSVALLARLREPGVAKVHSTYRSVLNLALPDGHLIAIADPSVGGLPNGVLVDLGPDARALGLREGQPAVTGSRQLEVRAAGIRILLDGATPWSPRIRDAGRAAADRWAKRSARVRSIAAQASATASGGSAPGFAGLLGGPGPRHLPMYAARAAAILDQLEAALAAGDGEAADSVSRRLVGLGPGLTPSGDDALVGLAAALHGLGHPQRGFLADAVADAGMRTTSVAASLLRHAAAGEFSERLHALLADLLGDDEGSLRGSVERALAWGATSGADCLVGVLFGLDVAAAGVRRAAASAP
jgi:hypothetical protein